MGEVVEHRGEKLASDTRGLEQRADSLRRLLQEVAESAERASAR
jgi:hypothetical protein